jgi:hypothetical protein
VKGKAMRGRVTVIIVLSFAALAIIFAPVLAQSEECAAMIQQAFAALADVCGGAGGNSACFGSEASADLNGSGGTFAAPGDIVNLGDVAAVSTAPLNLDAETLGLATLNVHANVPLALAEQGLRYFLFGDVTVENAVPADQAFTPAEPVTVTAIVGANLRSSPSTDGRVIANAPVGTELQADGLSADKNWLRALHEGSSVWVSRQVVATDGDLDALPIVGSSTRSLMQSFFLHTGTDLPSCNDAPPSMLVIQAPDGVNALITVNGADMRITSTVALSVLPGNVLYLFVLDGGANVNGLSVPAGFTMNVQLSEDGNSLAGSWTGLRPMNEGERNVLLPVQNLPEGVVYTAIQVPTQEQINAIISEINSGNAGQTISGPASGRADCSRFRPTSPLEGMPFGLVNFYWDAAQGATTYRLNVYNEAGGVAGSYDVNALSTTFAVDTGALGGGSTFTWDVAALVDGQVACTTGRVTAVRAAGSQPVGGGNTSAPPPTPVCTWGC